MNQSSIGLSTISPENVSINLPQPTIVQLNPPGPAPSTEPTHPSLIVLPNTDPIIQG